jgi:hypothetical protein
MIITTGISFPLQVENGNLKVSSGIDVIRDHIISFISTEKLERVMRLNYGIESNLFETESDLDVLSIGLKEALTSEIPQATFKITTEFNDLGELLIEIQWSVPGFDDPEPITATISN